MKNWLKKTAMGIGTGAGTMFATAAIAFADGGNPLTGSGVQGAGAAGGASPLGGLTAPFFQIVGVIIMVVLVWRIALNYIRGTHSSFIREILFGIIALVFVFDPTAIGPFIGWIMGAVKKIGG